MGSSDPGPAGDTHVLGSIPTLHQPTPLPGASGTPKGLLSLQRGDPHSGRRFLLEPTFSEDRSSLRLLSFLLYIF